ncbi:hypothetical protein [Lacinutrix sp. WUR7]|nr:hypothetical protein [Lacinutrix sp. WUR7]
MTNKKKETSPLFNKTLWKPLEIDKRYAAKAQETVTHTTHITNV